MLPVYLFTVEIIATDEMDKCTPFQLAHAQADKVSSTYHGFQTRLPPVQGSCKHFSQVHTCEQWPACSGGHHLYLYQRRVCLSLTGDRRLQQIHSRILSEQESGCGGTAESHVYGSGDLPCLRNQYGRHDTPL